MTDTKTRILDAAEHLFADQGFSATSLRHVIADAGVNLAAIHYHFGSKEELLSAVILRKVGPVNQERLRMLEQAEGRGTCNLEDVLRAFLEPAFCAAQRNPQIARLIGRLYGEPDLLPVVIRKNFGEIIARFGAALRRALPHLPGDELAWRTHFAVGAMAHALRLKPTMLDPASPPSDPEATCRRLVVFIATAMRAPITSADFEEELQ